MSQKADRTELQELEDRLMQLINQLQKQMANAATKDELTKKFKSLDKRIKELIELITRKGIQDDDGMLTKKNLGPIACASCEKNLINIQGLPVDYHAWKRMPQNNPSERIARYGQGFSKILSTLREDSNSGNVNSSVMQNHLHDKMTLY